MRKSSENSIFSALSFETMFDMLIMYSLIFHLLWYFMEIKFWRRVLLSTLSLFLKHFLISTRKSLVLVIISSDIVPQDLRNGALNDHETHAIGAIPLLIIFPLYEVVDCVGEVSCWFLNARSRFMQQFICSLFNPWNFHH
jgi:hypothetical protein